MPRIGCQISDDMKKAIAAAAKPGETKEAQIVRRLLAKALGNKALAEVPSPGRPWPEKSSDENL